MLNKQKLSQEIELVKSLRMITQAYEEISVMKMQKIRGSVLNTRQFMEKLAEVFGDVKSSYARQIKEMAEKKKIKDISEFITFNKNGKTVHVLLSANTKLYGDIISRTYRLFEEAISKASEDVIIIGKLGKELFDQGHPDRQYQYFEVPDMDFTVEDLKPVIQKITDYEKVIVYYGKFENIMTQNPQATNVFGNQTQEGLVKETDGEKARFLFEPQLEKVLSFFETQLFSSFFKQTAYEGQLARFASRITAMEEALQNIDTKMKNLTSQERRLRRYLENRKQLGAISGIALWSK
ncbi:MAG: F0F1 ATP synthase subunit gamma [Patescibacteria group bacterium]|jgi:F-type H+-transporting ATPase subunit gamma